MTNSILREKTNAGNTHGRVDDGETASAKPRRGALLDKFKTPVAVLLGALVSLAHGAVSITSPVDYATVTVMPSVMRDFRSTFATGKKWSLVNSSTLGSAQRVEWETACRASQTAVALSWSGTGSTMCTVRVYRAKDGAEVFSATSTTGKASFPDAEIGRNYRWTVTYNSSTTEGHFYVNRIAPRMMNSFGGIGNSRDLGGWTTDSGKVVRQGLVFRSEEWDFVDSATRLYRDGCEPKPYWADTVGVNLDIDLRAKEWVNSYYMPANDSRAALDKSPLDLDKNIRRFRTEDAGTSVGAFPGAAGFNAGGEIGGDPTVYTADQFKRAIAYAVHQFGNRDNYPILFHCSQGTDRTGALAYLLCGLLGVSEDDRDLDFVFSYAWDADEYKLSMWDMDTIRDTVNKCSGATFKDKCVTYVKNCYAMTTSPKLSATDAENDIATFRSMMLEDPEEAAIVPSGDEESFVYENYYWMCDGAGGTLSDGMSYWYKDPEGETKWSADQQNIVNNPNAAVYLWPTAAHPYAYPVAEAFTIGKLVSRISYGGTVGLVPGEPTTYEPNPSPKGYFTNTGHGVTDRPLWTHQSGVASAECLRMYLEAGTGTGSVQIWTNARLNLSAFESVYENVYIDFPAGKCDGATVCFYGLNGSQGESTVAWIQGGQDGTAQNLIVSNALLTVQRADKTSGVAGALNLEFDLGAANETTNTMMTVNGGFQMKAGSTIRVNAGGKPAGTYRLLTVGSGKTLTIPTATVRGAKVVGCAPGLAGTVALSGNVLSFTIVKTTTTVTIGDHPHLTVAWTGGDGSVTNAVDGTSFEVTNGTENVKVIFTADEGWEIVGDAVVDLGTVTENIVFGEGSGFLVPRVQYAPVPYVDIDEVRACDPWGTIAVGYTVDGTDADAKYEVAFEVTAGGRTASVTNGAVKLADGAATNEIDTVALFGEEIVDKDATVKISLIEAVLAPPPAGQLWEGGPIWAENNLGTSEVAEHPEYGALYTLAEATNAVVSLGQGWRVPSKDDFDKLIDDSYCTKGWDDTKKCWTFTGKGEYSSNSVFLAAAGHDSGSGRISGEVLGYYLSSTVDDDPRFPDTFVRNLFFNDVGHIVMTIDYLRYSMSVRAVRDDTEGRTIVDEKVVATAKAEFCLGPLVTVGDHPHMTAAWTSGDGSVTNAVEGAGFTVPKGTTNVRVIFTAERGWEIVGDAVVDLGTVTENIVFGEGSGFLVPRVQYAPVPYVDIDEVRACDPWGTIAVGYTVGGTDADAKYEVAFEVTAGGRTASVTNGAVKLADGAATNEIDTVALLGKEIVDKDATVKISLIEAVLAPPPAGQLWEGGPIWAENNFGTSEVAEHPEYGALYTLAEATNAVVSLGQGWRVPSKDDFDKLIDDSYCTKGWDDTKKGWTFMGRGEYSSNSVFLAAAGHDSGSGRDSSGVLGYYLSSTVDEDPRYPDTFDRNLFFNDVGKIFMTIDYLRYSMSVRAVRDDTEGRTIVGEKIVATAKAEFCLEPLVTVGDHPHLAAAWTSGDGSVTNEVEGAGFTVPVGMTDVRVIFTAEPGWEIVGGNVVTIETVTENITFGPESGFLVPVVRHEAVKYIDADGVERTKSAGEFDVVTEETRFLTNGWYAVVDDVVFPTNANLTVQGDVHLILCDGASLTVTNAAAWTAAVAVEDGASLSIYGQANGTGRLTAKGGNRAAGIGCAHQKDCGTISIHGGIVTATGGSYGAGIGSSSSCSNGCVVVTGGRIAAAKGNSQGSDIGNGGGKTTGCEVSISGGIFATPVDVAWCAEGYAPVANPDPATAADYPYTVLPAYRVTIGEHPNVAAAWTCGDKSVTNEIEGVSFGVMPPGTNDVTVIFSATDQRCTLDGVAVVNIGEVTNDVVFGVDVDFVVPRSGVRYLDWDAERNVATNAMVGVEYVTWVTTGTKTLADGKWYAVFGDIALTNTLPVEGAVHLILCDGSTLAIANETAEAAIAVGDGVSLTIYGQTNNTGRLEVRNGNSGAGIGGDKSGTCGTIAIHGGTVRAEGGTFSAGIGSGMLGGGGAVTITGGRIVATGHNNAEDIGSGYGATTPCEVSISGGLFWAEPQKDWLVLGCVAVENTDETTKDEYPSAVVRAEITVLPDSPAGPYATEAEATDALNRAVFASSADVTRVLTSGAARTRYAGWFGLGVASKAADEWYVEATLTDAAKSNLAASATDVTRQIPLSAIAALAEEATLAVTATNGVSGFYYTLHDGAVLTGIVPDADAANRDVLCGADGKVTFPKVGKPSDAMGFFRVGVDATK